MTTSSTPPVGTPTPSPPAGGATPTPTPAAAGTPSTGIPTPTAPSSNPPISSTPTPGPALTRDMLESWLRGQGFQDSDLQATDVRQALDAMFSAGPPTEQRFGRMMRDINQFWMFARSQPSLPAITAGEIVAQANAAAAPAPTAFGSPPVAPTAPGTNPGMPAGTAAMPTPPGTPAPAPIPGTATMPSMANPPLPTPAGTPGASAPMAPPQPSRPPRNWRKAGKMALLIGGWLALIALVIGLGYGIYSQRGTIAGWFTPSPAPAATDPAKKPKKAEPTTVARTLTCQRTLQGTVTCDVPDECSIGYSEDDDRKVTMTCDDELLVSKKTIKEMPLGAHAPVEMVALAAK